MRLRDYPPRPAHLKWLLDSDPAIHWQVMKDLGYDAEPFLDYLMQPAQLAKYKLVYVPNAPCLSDAQCAILRDYVRENAQAVKLPLR